ncbi:aminotransferase class I/II-fold pyridoxal phosphate-dependent enzyme, partial [Turicimonas muris]
MKPIEPNVFDFDTLIDRSSTISIKWSSSLRQKMYGDSNVIPMGIADMDFKCAPSIVEAINKRAAHETYGYGFSSEEYLDACVNWQKRRNHWKIESGWITYTPGINMAIVVAVEMFTEPGEKVIIQSPVYYPYYDYVTYKGRQIAFNPLLNKGGRYEMDFAELEKIASQKDTRMLILCSPHNPVGRCWEKDELKMVH